MYLLNTLPFVLPALAAPLVSRSTETWLVPTMDVHFMGRDTGIPGNQWPDSRKFNTTLDFTLTLPSSEVKCSANWKYQEVSTAEWPCGDGTGVSFHLGPRPDGAIYDASWTLTITRNEPNGVYVASKFIGLNDPGTPDSYLSCLGGPPYDGLRCKLNGWAGKPGPIEFTATSQ